MPASNAKRLDVLTRLPADALAWVNYNDTAGLVGAHPVTIRRKVREGLFPRPHDTVFGKRFRLSDIHAVLRGEWKSESAK